MILKYHITCSHCFNRSRLSHHPVQVASWNWRTSGIGPKFCTAPPVADAGLFKKTKTKKQNGKGASCVWQGTKRAQCHDAFMVTMFQSNLYHARQALNCVSSCWKLTQTTVCHVLLLAWPPWRAFCPAGRDLAFPHWLICFNPKPHWAERLRYCYSSNQSIETHRVSSVKFVLEQLFETITLRC